MPSWTKNFGKIDMNDIHGDLRQFLVFRQTAYRAEITSKLLILGIGGVWLDAFATSFPFDK